MMKYTLCHPEEFTHPRVAFLLGFFYMSILVVSEFLNIAKGSQRKSPQELITSYIGFKVITDIPGMYFKSIETLKIKAAVGKVTARKGRKSIDNKEKNPWYMTTIYVLSKWFFNSFYFYFFPFCLMYLPLMKVLYEKRA